MSFDFVLFLLALCLVGSISSEVGEILLWTSLEVFTILDGSIALKASLPRLENVSLLYLGVSLLNELPCVLLT